MLGETGPICLEFTQAALAANHQITLFVKSPGQLPGTIGLHPNVKVSVYETFGEPDGLERVMACGASVFVSFVGPREGIKGTPVTEAMKFVFHLLREYQYSRALILGTPAYSAPEDKDSLKRKTTLRLTKMADSDIYKDFSGLGSWMSTIPVEVVPWTLFRIHHLTDGAAKGVTATYLGRGKDKCVVTRKSLVNWVLEEMGRGEWVGKTPVLCN